MALADNLISHWKLDEASGTRNDSVGTNHLTDNNTVLSAAGKQSNAADFEASNSEYLSRASNSTLQMGDINRTFAAWVNLESLPADLDSYVIVGKDEASGRDYTFDYLKWNASPSVAGFRFYISGGGGANNQIYSGTTGYNSTGAWYFVVAAHDATNNRLRLYVNGTEITAVDTLGAVPPTTATEFRIGARSYSGFEGYFDGLIDEVTIWDRVLSGAEVTELYNAGAGRTYEYITGAATGNPHNYYAQQQ